jgi:hypothetical protein
MKQDIKDMLVVNLVFDGIALSLLIANGIYYHDILGSIVEFSMIVILSSLSIIPIVGFPIAIIAQLYYNVIPITPLVIFAWFFIMFYTFFESLLISIMFLRGSLEWIKNA